MIDEIKHIIKKTDELSDLIKTDPIFLRYNESIQELKGDSKAQEILNKLISLGKEISDQDESIAPGYSTAAEQKVLEEELVKHPVIKKHLVAQREYISLLQAVIQRIQNPE